MHRTTNPQSGQGHSLLEIARAYQRHGWSIIPIKAGTKRAACRSWKPYQQARPDDAKLKQWFSTTNGLGLAVICGEVSGDLVCRDFDTMEGYERWKELHPDLAATLPTVATARGRHVYFRAAQRKIVTLKDGELRGGGYCLLPPSRHPDGTEYRWLIPLPDGLLPYVDDVQAAGFLDSLHATETTERTETTEITEDNGGLLKTTDAMEGGGLTIADIESDVRRAILDTLPTQLRAPTGPGNRNHAVFEFARAMRAIPRFADANADDLENYVRIWHDLGLARGVIGTVPYDDTRGDFIYGWPRVKFPKGLEPMALIFEQAKRAPLPAAASRYECENRQLLVAWCRELQRASGDQPFFLGCRTAGKLLGVDHTTAWRWLSLLQHDRIIVQVEKGDRSKRRASRYRYQGD
ncbi:MAG TPA: bifunctional DNA primase/polymerase [Thermoguttaceae bacterium]|nr:bifunctional DNA primase/polymerase [Thermoguttaceae bacterium]